jgi:hypothetical protein
MKKKRKAAGGGKAKIQPLAYDAQKMTLLSHAAAYMERAHVEDYMLLMNRPWKLIWVNLVAGLSRGMGFFLGNIVLGILVLFLAFKILTLAFAHLGGVPWLGDQLKEVVGWMQQIMQQAQKGK